MFSLRHWRLFALPVLVFGGFVSAAYGGINIVVTFSNQGVGQANLFRFLHSCHSRVRSVSCMSFALSGFLWRCLLFPMELLKKFRSS
jgi:hypothetical protein